MHRSVLVKLRVLLHLKVVSLYLPRFYVADFKSTDVENL